MDGSRQVEVIVIVIVIVAVIVAGILDSRERGSEG